MPRLLKRLLQVGFVVCGLAVISLGIWQLAKRPALEWWWLRELEGAKDEVQARPAIEALGELRSARAVPKLAAMLAEIPESEPERSRHPVFAALLRIGGAAAENLFRSLEENKGDDRRDRLRMGQLILWRIGRDAVPSLVRGLSAKDERPRGLAAETLGMIGPGAASAAGDLVAALRDPSKEVRRKAIVALAQVESAVERLVPPLIQVLSDQDQYVRRVSAHLISSLGAAAAAAQPVLVGVLERAFIERRQEIIDFFNRWGEEAESSPVSHQTGLNNHVFLDADSEFQNALVSALGNIGPAAAEALPTLLTSYPAEPEDGGGSSIGFDGPAPIDLWRVQNNYRTAIHDAILRIAPGAEREIRYFAHVVLCDSEPHRVRAGLQGLALLGAHAEPALSSIAQGHADRQQPHAKAILEALRRLGPVAASTVPQVASILEDADPNLRALAASTLGAIGREAVAAIPALIKALDDPEPEVAFAAASALGIMGDLAAAAVPRLLSVIDSHELRLRRLGEDDWPRVHWLTEECIKAIGEMRSAGGLTIPTLWRLATEVADEWLRRESEGALVKLRPDSETIAKLERSSLTADLGTRSRAAELRRRLESPSSVVATFLNGQFMNDKGDWRDNPHWRLEDIRSLGLSEEECRRALLELAESDASDPLLAIKALGELHSQRDAVIPRLLEILASDDFERRVAAIKGLRRIGFEGEALREAAFKLLYADDSADLDAFDLDDSAAFQAGFSFLRDDPAQLPRLVAELAASLSDGKPDLSSDLPPSQFWDKWPTSRQLRCLEALESLGAASAVALPALRDTLDSLQADHAISWERVEPIRLRLLCAIWRIRSS